MDRFARIARHKVAVPLIPRRIVNFGNESDQLVFLIEIEDRQRIKGEAKNARLRQNHDTINSNVGMTARKVQDGLPQTNTVRIQIIRFSEADQVGSIYTEKAMLLLNSRKIVEIKETLKDGVFELVHAGSEAFVPNTPDEQCGMFSYHVSMPISFRVFRADTTPSSWKPLRQ